MSEEGISHVSVYSKMIMNHMRELIRSHLWPNCVFSADAKTGHAEGMACFGALRASRSGAG